MSDDTDKLGVEAKSGEHIGRYAERLIEAAKESGGYVWGEFNEITLLAHPSFVAEDLARFYDTKHRQRYEAAQARKHPVARPEPPMSIRDYYAGQALAGICANPEISWKDLASVNPAIANTAFHHADAMLAERAKGEPT